MTEICCNADLCNSIFSQSNIKLRECQDTDTGEIFDTEGLSGPEDTEVVALYTNSSQLPQPCWPVVQVTPS